MSGTRHEPDGTDNGGAVKAKGKTGRLAWCGVAAVAVALAVAGFRAVRGGWQPRWLHLDEDEDGQE